MRRRRSPRSGQLTDDKHFPGIAVETIFDYDINVNDIAIFQQYSINSGYVAHHFANRVRKPVRVAVIAETGETAMLFINNVIITDAIQHSPDDAGLTYRTNHLPALRRPVSWQRAFFRYLLGS